VSSSFFMLPSFGWFASVAGTGLGFSQNSYPSGSGAPSSSVASSLAGCLVVVSALRFVPNRSHFPGDADALPTTNRRP
jgi:hypothetical protein